MNRLRTYAAKLRAWLEETHGAGFELRRHFFRRFFDSDLVSTPGQWQAVAIGLFAIVVSLPVPLLQAYFHKYRMLSELDSDLPFRHAVMADHLFFITLAMTLTAMVTAIQWQSLFPGLRDYLVLAGLPVRTQQVFRAKFTALLVFMGIFVGALCVPPSCSLPFVMAGRYYTPHLANSIAMATAMAASAFFVFFALVALQGLLLNVTPPQWFPAISLLVQGVVFTLAVCALPLVISIPQLDRFMDQRPDFARWVPPAWFLALDHWLNGSRERYFAELGRIAWAAVGIAAFLAVVAYWWSYRRQKVRMLETPVQARGDFSVLRRTLAVLRDRLIPELPEQAVFGFTAATLSRSRMHRMVLTAFVAVALALIAEGFVSLFLNPRTIAANSYALRQAAASAPLALSLFVLAGYRYLFRLPVELRANWLFRVHEGGNHKLLLRGMEKFVFWFGTIPVGAITLPLEVRVFGWQTGVEIAVLTFLPALIVQEALLAGFDKIPFTSAYLPGQRPLIQTVTLYGAAFGAYVILLGGVIVSAVRLTGSFLLAFSLMLAIWGWLRWSRRVYGDAGEIEYEESMEPAVQTLAIFRD